MHSIRIARDEVKRLTASPLAAIAIVVVAMVPLLYGALYLWAFWDPYAHVADLPVALVNLDRPARAGEETITAGADLTAELVDRATFQWHVVSAQQAQQGLDSGDYYLALTIPADFSHDLATADAQHPRTARLVATSRESTNFIASQIGARVFSEVRTAAAESATRGYIDTMLLGFTDAHGSVRDAALGANDLAAGLRTARHGAQTLAEGASTAHSASAKLAEGSAELASGTTTLHDGTSKLATGARSLSGGITTAGEGARKLAAGAGSASSGAEALDEGLATASGGARSLADGAATARAGAAALASGTEKLASGADSLAASAHQLDSAAGQLDGAVSGAASKLGAAASGAREVSDGSASTAELLASYAAAHPEAAEDPEFARALGTSRAVADGAADLAGGLSDASAELPALAAGVSRVAAGSSKLASGADQLASNAHTAATGAGGLADGTARLDAGAGSLAGGLTSAKDGSGRLADGTRQLAEGTSALAGGLHSADKGGRALTSGLHDVNAGAAKLTSGARQLARGTNQLHAGLGTLDAGSAALAEGLAPAVSGSRELAGGLTAGADSLPSYTSRSRTAHAEMMSDPVRLEERRIDPVPNYGTGFAPYFIPLALWVGALIAYLLIRPLPDRASGARGPEALRALGGFWPGALVAAAQAALLLAVVRLGLGLTAHNALALYALTLLTALCFVAIIQMLGAALGPAGKLVAIVMLMLQLTSSAGTYPIETVAPFFQAIHPLLPMTYAVSGLRAAISGGSAAVMLADAAVIAAWGIGALAVTSLVAQRGGSPIAKRLDAAIEM